MGITKSLTKQKGFTLLEVLLVVAVLAILAGIVIIAINPSKNLADTRNAQRSADVTTILNGIYQYALDTNGAVPTTIPSGTASEICATTGAPCTTGTPTIDLGVVTAGEKYLASIPKDPQCGTAAQCTTNGTGYRILKTTGGRVTVSAPIAEGGKTISVTR